MAGTRWWSRWNPGRALAALVLGGLVAGCDVGPAFKSPNFPFLGRFAAARTGEPVLLENAAWWRRFDDPLLDRLVELALDGNLDLERATERVREARAQVDTVPGGATLSTEASYRVVEGANGTRDSGPRAALNFDWLFDPWGGRKAQLRAAGARAEVAEAEVDAARLLLLRELNSAYVDMRYQQHALALRQRELRSRRQTLELVQKRFEAKAATRLDVLGAQALIAETEARIPAHRAAARARMNEIAVLVGRIPGTLGIPLENGSIAQPAAGLPSEIGIPADLVRNRPDIRIAERLYYAAVADTGVARAELYPALSLGGMITLSVLDGVRGTDYYFGPSLRLPALPDGPRQAAVAVRASRARQAHTAWKATVLGAIGEVESALVAHQASTAAVAAAQKAVRLRSETVTLTRDLIAKEGATVRDLLEAEEAVATARIALAQAVQQAGQDFVSLNVALGSGNGYGATARK